MATGLTPPTEGRVPQHSTTSMNLRIRDATIERVRQAAKAPPAELGARLHKLDREWDMERTLEFNASMACLTGLLLGMVVGPGWYWFSMGVVLFLAQHAIQGWCPPMPVFRRLGFRTAEEIMDEKTALRVLRGEFGFLKSAGGSGEVVEEMVRNKRERGSFVGVSAALKKEE